MISVTAFSLDSIVSTPIGVSLAMRWVMRRFLLSRSNWKRSNGRIQSPALPHRQPTRGEPAHTPARAASVPRTRQRGGVGGQAETAGGAAEAEVGREEGVGVTDRPHGDVRGRPPAHAGDGEQAFFDFPLIRARVDDQLAPGDGF